MTIWYCCFYRSKKHKVDRVDMVDNEYDERNACNKCSVVLKYESRLLCDLCIIIKAQDEYMDEHFSLTNN